MGRLRITVLDAQYGIAEKAGGVKYSLLRTVNMFSLVYKFVFVICEIAKS